MPDPASVPSSPSSICESSEPRDDVERGMLDERVEEELKPSESIRPGSNAFAFAENRSPPLEPTVLSFVVEPNGENSSSSSSPGMKSFELFVRDKGARWLKLGEAKKSGNLVTPLLGVPSGEWKGDD